jgi:hypothetical protein
MQRKKCKEEENWLGDLKASWMRKQDMSRQSNIKNKIINMFNNRLGDTEAMNAQLQRNPQSQNNITVRHQHQSSRYGKLHN